MKYWSVLLYNILYDTYQIPLNFNIECNDESLMILSIINNKQSKLLNNNSFYIEYIIILYNNINITIYNY